MNLLDTGIIVEMIKEKKHEAGVISPITLIEILRGIETKKRPKVKELLEESFNLVNIDNKTIETYCTLYHKLREEGILIPDADLLIAATAITYNLTLETKDEHFQRLKPLGLKLTQMPEKQNPQKASTRSSRR
jgi:predicted nucleic acid-binding protein